MLRRAGLLAGCAAVLSAAPVAAQDSESVAEAEVSGNVIIVTATKRDEDLQDIPFSINAQTAEDIQRSGAVNLEDVSRLVAGLSIQNLGPGQSQVAIRGVSAGQIVRDQPGVKEQVGVYLDESVISLSLFTPDLDLFDLNRVETLRGPQGTLFGSGSIGGTIRYITNQPNLDTVEGMIEADLNLVDVDDIGYSLKGAVNVPLVEDVAAIRAVGYYTQFGGFINALTDDGIIEDVNSGERYGGRLALTVKPVETVTITPRIVYQEIISDGFNRQETFNLFANPFTTTRPPIQLGEREQFLRLREEFRDETLIADLVVDVELGGTILTSVTSYSDREILVSRDASALTGSVSVDLGFPDAGVLLPSNLQDTTDLSTFTQELRLASNNDSRFQWVFGGFYSDIERDYTQRLPTPGYDGFTDAVLGAGTAAAVANGFPADSPFNSDLDFNIEQYAVFGEASYEVTDRLTLTAGGRYYDFEEDRTIITGGLFAAGGPLQEDVTASDGFTPRFLASFDVSENVTINAQAAQGFRLGGVNDPLNTGLCDAADFAIFGGFQDFDDETLWNYELGLKSQFGAFTFNAAGFYTEIDDLQVTLDAGSCSSRISFNVPEAHTLGFEWEFAGQVAPGLDIGISGSVLEAEIDSAVLDGAGTPFPGLQPGDRLPSVPEFQVSADATYRWDVAFGEAFLNGTFQHVGDRITQPGDQFPELTLPATSGLPFAGATGLEPLNTDPALDSYELVNLSAGIDLENELSITVYLRNVFDVNPLLSFDRERGGRARTGFRVGQPRTLGVTLRKGF
ncbi:TonB-dependent receptor [Erythrobacter rubeus]|uniref:TonB-dependent receptor n=1 Tax=Erythrobacter rubeus TaxID=2760803 RepID=A0ABR8KUX6_9SPHN|nr:TonB-dependent receptor [Erythrobacter rubeus]MBD2843390.1 TonB-dependent receptor [Erythrobacter rubeus]